jgi:hypothetical protein
MDNAHLRAVRRESDAGTGASERPHRPPSWVVALLLGGLSFAFSVLLIRAHPTMFWSDGYSRLFERQHVIVDRWLPLTQIVVFALSKFTTNVTTARLVFAGIAAGTVACAAILGEQLFAYSTGVIFSILLASNAIFAALAIAPYQEVPFLGLAFVSIALHERRASTSARWAAVASFNALCLTRYEGWLLVAILAVAEMVSEARRTGLPKAAIAAIALGVGYGSTAIGWLIFLFLRPELSKPWQPGPTSAHPARHLAVYLYRSAWELGGCEARKHPGSAVVLAFALGLFALTGLVCSLSRAQRHRSDWTIVAWVFSGMALVILIDPYFDEGNLRQTFLPVVFALLYAAEGLRLTAEWAVDRLIRSPVVIRSTALVSAVSAAAAAATALLATLSAQGTARFVAASSAEPDFRIPAAVGRRLAYMVRAEGPGIRVATLSDNRIASGIIAVYAGLPFASVRPMAGDLPEAATHVVFIPRADESLSGAELALKQRLQSGTLPADPVPVDSAVIWKLRTQGQGGAP